MDCTICNEVKEDAPALELLCGHTFHTECWLRRHGGAEALGGLRCTTCNAYIIPDEMHAEFTAATNTVNTGTEIVKFMWAENENFKKFIIESMKKWKNHKKSSAILKKKGNELLKNEDLLELRQLIKAKLAELHKELTESPEYKEAIRNQRINTAVGTTLPRVWGVTGWDVRHALKEEPEVQAFIQGRSWTHRLERVIRKFKYYRIR
jgi:hypothetical protein